MAQNFTHLRLRAPMIYQKQIESGWQNIDLEEYKFLFNSETKVQAVVLYSENKPKKD